MSVRHKTSLKSRIIYVGVGTEVTITERPMVHKKGLHFLDLLQKGGQRYCSLPNVLLVVAPLAPNRALTNSTDCRV